MGADPSCALPPCHWVAKRLHRRGPCGVYRTRSPRPSRNLMLFSSSKRRPSWAPFLKAFGQHERVAKPLSARGKCEPQTHFPRGFSRDTKVRATSAPSRTPFERASVAWGCSAFPWRIDAVQRNVTLLHRSKTTIRHPHAFRKYSRNLHEERNNGAC